MKHLPTEVYERISASILRQLPQGCTFILLTSGPHLDCTLTAPAGTIGHLAARALRAAADQIDDPPRAEPTPESAPATSTRQIW